MSKGFREAQRRARRRRRLVLLGVIGAAAAVVVATVVALNAGGSKPYTVASNSNATDAGALTTGASFPDFAMTDVSGRSITKASLENKPSVIWFTTSYCVPCQVGATRVAQLEDGVGAGAFNVLVVFVDPKESASDLRRWRQQFGRPDWMVGLDNGLANRVQLRYLDTKYLLDKQGVIQDVNVNIADDQYLSLIRQTVQKATSQ